jgi:tetratricopeptide (TPR) repeat protein
MRASEQRSYQRAKLSRKDLKAPDEFITLTGRALSFATQHLRPIGLIVGGIAVAVLGAWGLLAYVHSLERAAFVSLWQSETQLRGAADTGGVPPDVRERLQQITQQFGAGRARGYAWHDLGQVHYRQGDYPAAVVAYQHAMAEVRPSDLLWSLSALGVAYALEASGEFKQAQEAYQRVIDAKPVGLSMEAYLGKGRTAEQRQEVETAIGAYAAVLDRFPARAGALGLQDKIEVLKAQR